MVAARIRSEWQYRSSFVLTTVLQLVASLTGIVTIAAIFTNVAQVGGWSFREVALLYGMGGTAFSLADAFITQVEMASPLIRSGGFDRLLLRPAPPMLQLCASEFAYRRLNKIAQAVVVLVLSAAAVEVRWDAIHLLVLVASIATGATIYGALWVIYCSVSFWAVNNNEFVYAAVTVGEIAGRYPFEVFRSGLRRVLTMIIPIGFVSYYPACWLLGRDPVGQSTSLFLAAPAVALALVLIASTTWRAGVRRYQGTGS